MFISNPVGITQFYGPYDLSVNLDQCVGADTIIPVSATFQSISNYITVTCKFTFVPTQIDPRVAFIANFNQEPFADTDQANGVANVRLVTVPTGMDGSAKVISSSSGDAPNIFFDFITPGFDSIQVYECQAVFAYTVTPLSELAFISSWKTDNAGDSDPDQIQLPLSPTGTYNFVVNWGDGTSNVITAWDQVETLHTYDAVGTYTVHILGICEGWALRDNPGDNEKLIGISQWGNFKMGDGTLAGGYFFNTTNLSITALDVPDLTGVTSFKEAFFNSGITSIPTLFEWIFSSITDFESAWEGCTTFDGVGLSACDFSNATTLKATWKNCPSFNENMGLIVTSAVTTMFSTFEGDTSFDQNLGAWDVASLTTAQNMFAGVTLSTPNYDALLIGWASQAVQSAVVFSGGNSQYSPAAASARNDTLISFYLWSISDGGPA